MSINTISKLLVARLKTLDSKEGTKSAQNFLVEINEFFSEKDVARTCQTVKDKTKVLLMAIHCIHPDTAKETFNHVAHIIEALQEYRSNITSNAKASPDIKSQFLRSCTDRLSFQSVSYYGQLSKKYEPILIWLQKDTMRLNPFIRFVENIKGPSAEGESNLIYTRNRNTFLLRIMLLEMLLKVLPELKEKTTAEVLSQYLSGLRPPESRQDPLLWLYDEMVLDHCQTISPGNAQRELDDRGVMAQWTRLNDLVMFLDHFGKYPNAGALENLISLDWSNEELHVKALLEEMRDTFDRDYDALRQPTNVVTLSTVDSTPVITVQKGTNLYQDLANFHKLELGSIESIPNPYDLPTSIQLLESCREELSDYITRLPTSFLCAIAQDESGASFIGDDCVGNFLMAKLNLVNQFINNERSRLGYPLEEQQYQPAYDIPDTAMVGAFHPSGVLLYLRQEVKVVSESQPYNCPNNPLTGRQSARDYLCFPGATDIPECISPSLVGFLNDCFQHYKIQSDYNGGLYVQNCMTILSTDQNDVLSFLTTTFEKHRGQEIELTLNEAQLLFLIAKKYLANANVQFMQKPLEQLLVRHTSAEVRHAIEDQPNMSTSSEIPGNTVAVAHESGVNKKQHPLKAGSAIYNESAQPALFGSSSKATKEEKTGLDVPNRGRIKR